MEQGKTPITEELLQSLVLKYQNAFMEQFPTLHLTVERTFSGRPRTDDVPFELLPALPEAPVVSGLFFNIDTDYRIGITKNNSLPGQLMTFFHEYGHACYRQKTNEAIDNPDAKIRTETAALRCSLRLADAEGLPEVAYLAVDAAHSAALISPEYKTALENVQNDPLWQKYSKTN